MDNPVLCNIDKRIEGLITHAERICLANGSKLTRKRAQILFLLLTAQRAISAYTLIDLYHDNFDESLSAVSAYRILDFLESVQLVHKLHIANKYISCAFIGANEEHKLMHFMVCKKCQFVHEFSTESLNLSELVGVARQSGCELDSPQVELSCICNECSQ